MIYLAIALVIMSLIFTKHPPQFHYHKTINVRHLNTPVNDAIEQLSEQELKEALSNAPPTVDDIMQAVNESLFDLDFEGSDE